MLESFLRRLIWTAAGRSPLLIPVEVFWAWGFIWFPAALGIWLLVKEHFTVLMTWFLLSIVALLASMFFAEDTAREVAILSPVFVISIAQLCTTLITTGRQRWVKLLMTVAVVQLFIALPNVVLGEEVWSVVRWGKVGLLAAGTAASAGLLFVRGVSEIAAALEPEADILTSRRLEWNHL